MKRVNGQDLERGAGAVELPEALARKYPKAAREWAFRWVLPARRQYVALKTLLKERGLTQARAAKLLGVTQPRVSDLMRGRIDLFSIDTLVDRLARLGVSVTLRTKRSHSVA